jgi:protoporphyrinogen oxidase
VSGDRKIAVIIGAGPAGLTAAYELLTRSNVLPIVIEKSAYMGGLSRTMEYKGNRIDIGGHRFFSKSDRVMNWWLQHMPLEPECASGQEIAYQGNVRTVPACAPRAGNGHPAMLLRDRKSRIYFLRKFFDYPIQLNAATLANLGLWRVTKIGASYMRSMISPPRRVENLEQFLTSRFGGELYRTFFKSYTEKVWGVPCEQISAEWGAQRIKALSVSKAVWHMLKKVLPGNGDVRQKDTETSLIERFLYPKLGPGQLWEEVADKVMKLGGRIHPEHDVEQLLTRGERIAGVVALDQQGNRREFGGDYFFSTMPIKELINSLDADVPAAVRDVSNNLSYRDFIIVGLLVKKLKVQDKGKVNGKVNGLIRDNWIYIQDPEVQAGRLQIYNNWSPHMVRDPDTVWLGVEYFCCETDGLWNLPDDAMTELAVREMVSIGIVDAADVMDATVVRMPKAYPAYFGVYDRFPEVRSYIDRFTNLFPVGRNGMHKYNNQDHSMLAAMTAVDNILEGRVDKSNIWAVNTEMEYHEQASRQAEELVGRACATDSRYPSNLRGVAGNGAGRE